MTCAKDATPGFASNDQQQKLSWIFFTGTLDAAVWGCELARGDGRERIYVVERPDIPNSQDEFQERFVVLDGPIPHREILHHLDWA